MTVGEPPGTAVRGTALDVVLSVTDSVVRLSGAGVDVSAPHGGVRPGLSNAVYDVRLERARSGQLSRPRADAVAVRDLAADGAAAGLVSLRRAGELLAESFLPGRVADALRGLLGRAVREHVAFRLAVDAPGLAWLPWEALPDPVTGQPLALHPLAVVYRRSNAGVEVPARLAGPLRIVVAIASPVVGGGPLLDYEHELRAVLAAVRGARRAQGRVEVVPFATTAAIRSALNVPGGVHVLHISAHGRPGVLILEDEDGRAREVTAEQLLAEAVPAGRMPPVISLAACYTDAEGESAAASYSAQLAARGAGAVIGTQTSVSDRYATLLFSRVYAELAANPDAEVVQAVADARRLVQQELMAGSSPACQRLAGMDEWGVVTLLASAGAVPVVDHGLPLVAAPAVRSAQWGQIAARPVGQFVGRRALQRRLPAMLDGDDYAGLALHGIGGVGKTTLAAEVLRRTTLADPGWRVASLFGKVTVDGILAEVAALARRELLVRGTVAGSAAQAVAAATRAEVAWQDRFALLREYVLDEVHVLVVLDNFEDNLTPDGTTITDPGLAELLATWVMAPAGSRLLITSRHPVALPGPAAGRLLAQPVGPLSAAETGKLLWSLPHIDRHATTDATVEQIWRVVGGHPRSLEYLDALLGQGQARFEDITACLTAAVQARLGPDAASWLVQDRTLDAALADTVTLAADDVLLAEHLDRLAAVPGAVDLLTAISVHREPVPVLALVLHIGAPGSGAQVATDTGAHLERQQTTAAQPGPAMQDGGRLTSADRHTLRDLLDTLRVSSLIHHDPATGTVFMHRWTASELHHRWHTTATLDPGKDPIRRAHHTAAAYRRWRVEVWPQDAAADLHDLEEARHHLIAAGDLDTAVAVTEQICTQLKDRGAWDRAAGLTHDTLRWLPADSPRRPAFLHFLGVLAHSLGDYTEAERRYQQALTLKEQLGGRADIADTHHQLGILAQHRGDYAEAGRRFQQALTINEQFGDQAGTADSYHQLGNLAYLRGDYAEAERRYQQALTINERPGDQARIAGTHHQLGMLAHNRGSHADAEHRYQQALTIFERLGDQAGIAGAHHQLGVVAHFLGDHTEAGHRYQQSLTINERLGDQAGAASNHHQLGNLAYLRGDHIEAGHRFQRSLAINERLGDQAGAASNHHQLGILAHHCGDHSEAERRYRQSLTIKRQIGNQAGIASSYHQLGNLACLRGDHIEAEDRFQRSLAINERLGNRAGAANSMGQLADLRAMTGDGATAVQLHIRALSIRLDIGAPQAARNIIRLRQLRDGVGADAFGEAARDVLDDASRSDLVALLGGQD